MTKAFAGYVSLVLVFGDAVRQATPDQRKTIELQVMPLFEDLKEVGITKAREIQLLRRILYRLSSIMGSTWQLEPETKEWIGRMIT